MTTQSIFSNQITRPSTVGLIGFNTFLLLAAMFSVGVALTALYHALIFALSNA